MCLTFGPQLVALFWEVVEPLGSRTSLEVGHWGFTDYPASCPASPCKMLRLHCRHHAAAGCLACHDELHPHKLWADTHAFSITLPCHVSAMTTTDTNLEEGRNIFWGSYWEECQDCDLVLSFPDHHEARVAVSLKFRSAYGVHTPVSTPTDSLSCCTHLYSTIFPKQKYGHLALAFSLSRHWVNKLTGTFLLPGQLTLQTYTPDEDYM